jgi:hypothetical protein
MSNSKETILPILLTGIWINLSETIRWVFLIKSYWLENYEKLGLVYSEKPINLMMWMIWGFLLATIIFLLSKKFTVLHTTLLSWFSVFVMMWVVVWNIGVLPIDMLWINIPLSFIEIYIGALICKRLKRD